MSKFNKKLTIGKIIWKYLSSVKKLIFDPWDGWFNPS